MRFQQRIPFRVVTFSLALLLVAPSLALAQRRFVVLHRPARVVSLGFGWGWGYPYPAFGWYDTWYQPFGPFGPYGSPYFQPYGYGPAVGDIRLDATPKQAEVYVDGYRAGVVDDFDGIFQRLHVRPGEHDIALYLPGYRTIIQHVYVNPGSDQRIRLTMVALAEGQPAEAPPQPTTPPQSLAPREPMRGGPPPMRGQEPPRTTPAPEPAKFGTLSLRIVPANADVWIDGEHWRNLNAAIPLVIQLSEGKHKIEIARENYQRYANEIEIKAGEANSINVSLTRNK